MSDHGGALSAAVDIGSNTVRLLVYRYGPGGRLVRLKTLRAVTRLGEFVQTSGEIAEESTSATINALLSFKKECASLGVRDMYAIGTSALRDAKNADVVADRIRRETGISLEVVSGETEAHLTLVGMLEGFSKDFSYEDSLLVDIGGGSTEWAITRSGAYRRGSLPLGALGLFLRHVINDPPSQQDISAMEREIMQCIHRDLVVDRRPDGLILTGGTAATLAAVDLKLREYDGEKIHLHQIRYDFVRGFHDELVSMSRAARLSITGLEPDRADIIIAGNLIVLIFLRVFDLSYATVSDYGLLEGIAAERRMATA